MYILREIELLVFSYAIEPIYTSINPEYRGWSRANDKLKWVSGSNPLASFHIKKLFNKLKKIEAFAKSEISGYVVDTIFYGVLPHKKIPDICMNPHPKIIELIKQNPDMLDLNTNYAPGDSRIDINIHQAAFNQQTHDPEFTQMVFEKLKEQRMTRNLANSMHNEKYWAVYGENMLREFGDYIQYHSLSKNNMDICSKYAQYIPFSKNKELSENPNAIDFLNAHPEFIDGRFIQKNPNLLIIDMLSHLIFDDIYTLGPQVENIYRVVKNTVISFDTILGNSGAGELVKRIFLEKSEVFKLELCADPTYILEYLSDQQINYIMENLNIYGKYANNHKLHNCINTILKTNPEKIKWLSRELASLLVDNYGSKLVVRVWEKLKLSTQL